MLLVRSGTREARRQLRRSTSIALLVAVALSGTLGLRAAEVIVDRELARSFADTNPASIVVLTSGVDDELLRSVEELPGVRAADGRSTRRARIRSASGLLVPLDVTVVADPFRTRVNSFAVASTFVHPTYPTLWIDEGSLAVLDVAPGQIVQLDVVGTTRRAVIGESVDEGIPPGTQGIRVFGHASSAAADALGLDGGIDEVRVAVAPGRDAGELLPAVTQVVADSGRTVRFGSAADIPRHPQTAQMSSVLDVTRTFAVLTSVVALLLVTQVAAGVALAARRQLAVLALIGAGRRPVIGRQAAVFGPPLLVGAVGGTLGGLWFGGVVAGTALEVLSIRPDRLLPPPSTVVVANLVLLATAMAAVAVATLVVGVRPVMSTLRAAPARSRVPAGLRRLGAGPAGYAVRSLVRRPLRAASVVAALALAGGMILTGTTLRAGWQRAAEEEVGRRDFDVVVRVDPSVAAEAAAVAVSVPTVGEVEAWAVLPLGDSAGPSATGGSLGIVIAVRADSAVLATPVVAGRPLDGAPGNGAVLDTRLARTMGVTVGEPVTLPILGLDLDYEVAGIVAPALGSGGEAFVDLDALTERLGFAAVANLLYLRSAADTADARDAVARSVDEALLAAGVPVIDVRTIDTERERIANHILALVVILLLLGAMAAAIALVGVAATGELNIQERRREIAVLRLVGATSGRLSGLIALEGVLVAAMSSALAPIVGLLIARGVAADVGRALLGRPVPVELEPLPAVGWAAVSVALAAVAAAGGTQTLVDRPLAMEITAP
ncbi:MAG: ABC transporter permease [Actinomycetota bacterium]